MNSTFTRRAFLRRTALAAGALSATPLLSPNILRAQDAGKKVNCVQIGCGARALAAHIDWIVEQAKDNLVAIVDPDEKQHAKVMKYLQDHGLVCCSSAANRAYWPQCGLGRFLYRPQEMFPRLPSRNT